MTPRGRAVSAAVEIAAALTARGETLAVAETAGGGLISAALLAIPGASSWFLGGAVAYSAAAKAAWLGLSTVDLAPHGVVSEQGAWQLAKAVRHVLNATWGVAEVGIAGPQTGRRSSKPAGLAYLAVAGPSERVLKVETGFADRARNQRAFAAAALQLLAAILGASD